MKLNSAAFSAGTCKGWNFLCLFPIMRCLVDGHHWRIMVSYEHPRFNLLPTNSNGDLMEDIWYARNKHWWCNFLLQEKEKEAEAKEREAEALKAKTAVTSFYTPPKVVRSSAPQTETSPDKAQLASLGITNAGLVDAGMEPLVCSCNYMQELDFIIFIWPFALFPSSKRQNEYQKAHHVVYICT